jgi:hypothetical protein
MLSVLIKGILRLKSLSVPYSETNGVRDYNDDQICDHIYLAVLKQIYNMYKVGLFDVITSINASINP